MSEDAQATPIVIGPLTERSFPRYAEVRQSFFGAYAQRFLEEDNGPAYLIDVVSSYLGLPEPVTFDSQRSEQDIVLVAASGTRVLAFACCHFFPATGMAMVSSFARIRGAPGHVVPRLEDALLAELRQRACRLLVFEIQDPFSPRATPRERPRRRQRALHFTRAGERLGVVGMVQRYAPPKLDLGGPEPEPLLLVWFPLMAGERAAAGLREQVLSFVILDCYGFGDAADDPYRTYLEARLGEVLRDTSGIPPITTAELQRSLEHGR
jgi:hypothetical protein